MSAPSEAPNHRWVQANPWGLWHIPHPGDAAQSRCKRARPGPVGWYKSSQEKPAFAACRCRSCERIVEGEVRR